MRKNSLILYYKCNIRKFSVVYHAFKIDQNLARIQHLGGKNATVN